MTLLLENSFVYYQGREGRYRVPGNPVIASDKLWPSIFLKIERCPLEWAFSLLLIASY